MCLLFICISFIFYSFWTYNIAVAVAPVINNLPNTTTLHEDTSTAYVLYILDVTDADGDSITCSFGPGTTPGSGTSKFDIQYISASTAWGIFTTTSGYDYSSQSSYSLEIDCDANGDTATGTYIIYLTQNQSPVINNLPDSVTVSTLTAAVGDTVFWVNGTDAENDQIRFSITCDPATPACPFKIFDSGNIQLNAEILDTTVTGYDVTVDIADSSGNGTSQTLTILFTDLNNPPEIQNLGSTINVAENTALGAAIVTTTCKDNDVSDTLIYSMACTPSTGSTYFQIDSSSGAITASSTSLINYEYLLGAGSTSFTCTVTCGDGRTTDTATVDFDITDVNEKPTFSQTAYSISANEGAGGTVIQVTAFSVTEEDTGDSLTFSLDCGTSTGYFTINTNTGIISFSTDYDVDDGTRPTSVSCSVTVTDSGGSSDTSTVDITINNLNDNVPVFSQNSYVWFLAETDAVGTTVGTAAATDGDIGTFGTVTYSLDQSTLSAEYFQIDQSGIVTLKSTHSAGVAPSFYVLGTDGGGTETRVTATVVITATTTSATTTSGDRYKTFFDDGRNIAWFTACCVLLFITIVVTVWLCFIYKGAPSAYEYSKFRFRCCTFSESEEEPLTLHPRNWGEGHRNGF